MDGQNRNGDVSEDEFMIRIWMSMCFNGEFSVVVEGFECQVIVNVLTLASFLLG